MFIANTVRQCSDCCVQWASEHCHYACRLPTRQDERLLSLYSAYHHRLRHYELLISRPIRAIAQWFTHRLLSRSVSSLSGSILTDYSEFSKSSMKLRWSSRTIESLSRLLLDCLVAWQSLSVSSGDLSNLIQMTEDNNQKPFSLLISLSATSATLTFYSNIGV